jgi:curved DNA-binding protein CbpA
MKDFYAILQVSPNASTEVIRASYRVLAKRYHPDNKETGNPTMFRAVKEAEAILCDEQKRKEYDLQGAEAQYSNGHRPPQQGRLVWKNGIGWVFVEDPGPYPGDFPTPNYGAPTSYAPGQMEELVRETAYNLGHSFVDRLMEEFMRNARRHR